MRELGGGADAKSRGRTSFAWHGGHIWDELRTTRLALVACVGV